MKFQLTATQLSLVISFVIPALVALITKSAAAPAVKQITLIALSAIGGWFATATSTSAYDLQTVLIAIGTTFIFSVGSYIGLKSIITNPIEAKTGTVGIG